ncbi:hypothetical protein F2P81_008393 [Scophthalmus maximus]|uniref:Uncharacterized protein n=1 Tax=Scophthalmus maximus TaxID=52904 RepID=A0A6A4T761_SCOMX|nr:hypothetical protein F2P81_008393 [Scophthalmus maximus]
MYFADFYQPPADSELWNSQIRLYDRDDSAAANRLFAVQSTDVCHKLIRRINLHAVSSGRDSRREETRNDRTDEKEKGKQPQRDAKYPAESSLASRGGNKLLLLEASKRKTETRRHVQ